MSDCILSCVSYPVICPGDHTVSVCHHCGKEVRRGKVGAAKAKCGNTGMAQHLERQHKEAMEEIKEARARSSAEALGKVYDEKDESVRGSVILFNLNNNLKRQGREFHQICTITYLH